jgi:hypothetical protein
MDIEKALVIASSLKYEAIEPITLVDDMTIHIKNIGRNIAHIDEFNIIPIMLVGPQTMPVEPKYTIGNIVRLTSVPIIPSEDKPVVIHTTNDPFPTVPREAPGPHTPEGRLAAFKNGDIRLTVYGFIKYKTLTEVDPRQRISGICFEYVPLARRGRNGEQFAVCPNGNYTYIR